MVEVGDSQFAPERAGDPEDGAVGRQLVHVEVELPLSLVHRDDLCETNVDLVDPLVQQLRQGCSRSIGTVLTPAREMPTERRCDLRVRRGGHGGIVGPGEVFTPIKHLAPGCRLGSRREVDDGPKRVAPLLIDDRPRVCERIPGPLMSALPATRGTPGAETR
jgi:hypothetical protein